MPMNDPPCTANRARHLEPYGKDSAAFRARLSSGNAYLRWDAVEHRFGGEVERLNHLWRVTDPLCTATGCQNTFAFVAVSSGRRFTAFCPDHPPKDQSQCHCVSRAELLTRPWDTLAELMLWSEDGVLALMNWTRACWSIASKRGEVRP
jgi:hypothetical protein